MTIFKHNAAFFVVVLEVGVCFRFLLIATCATGLLAGEGLGATFREKVLSRYSTTAEVTTLTYMKGFKVPHQVGPQEHLHQAKAL